MNLIVNIQKKLRDFTLNVDFQTKDEVFALLGASGCGKSMTLKCIAGIETPDSGFISLNGKVLFDSKNKINLPPQKRKIGYLFQNYALFPNMTVIENIAFAATGDKKKKVQENIKRFALEGLEKAYPNELSGGQQQRTALARILAADCELLLLDEPFSALDNYLKWQIELELTKILKEYGNAALLVSHDRGEVFRLANTIAVLNKGNIDALNTKHELFADPKTLAATLLTGCKNVSKAHYVDEHTLYANDWNTQLHSTATVPQNLRYVALRAHYITAAEDNTADNTFTMNVYQEIEDTFSYIIMVKPAENDSELIRWEVDKATWKNKKSESLLLCLPSDKLILLTQ